MPTTNIKFVAGADAMCPSIKFTPARTKFYKGAFNNYVDKIRGEGVKKCLFLSTLRV